MLLEKLPLELVHRIIELVLCDNNPRDFTALLGINKILETETTKLYLRSIRDVTPDAARWKRTPFPLRRRIARDTILNKPSSNTKRNIVTYMHAVASYLTQYSKTSDAENTGLLSRKQWLYEISDVLALHGADCKCGKPAFMHSKCYDLACVPDTAFHVAILKRHTRLEMVMIEEGRSWDSVCPYLKVSKRDPMFTRRNALEWACAYGFEDTVHRLLQAAEEEGKKYEEYIPTAAAIAAAVRGSTNHEPLLRFLLDCIAVASWVKLSQGPMFQYQNRVMSFREWNRRVLSTLAMHKKKRAIYVMRKHYPYLEFQKTLELLPRNWCREAFGKHYIEKKRPYCDLVKTTTYGVSSEWERHFHWLYCSSEVCHNRYSKANPFCEKCRRHHLKDSTCFARCDELYDELYDRDGYPMVI